MADTTVTGRIGDQEVQLINAASEATLQKLLEAFNKMSGSGGGSSSGGGTGGSGAIVGKAATNTASALNKAGDAVGKFAGAIASATAGLLSWAGAFIGATLKSVQGLAKELLIGGERVSDFTKHLADLPSIFGVLGGLLHSLSSYIDKNIDVWRDLSQVGAAFNNSIFEMRHTAAMAGMNIEEFSNLVKTNSQTMAMFGTSVTNGVKGFANLSKEMRNGKVGSELMNMGFTMTDLNESLLNYANINARTGRMRENSDKDLVERAGAFAKEMDLAAKVTGLNRKQLESSANAAMMDARMRTIIGGIQDKDQRNRALANLAVMDSMKGLSPAFKDLATGAPMLEESFMLQNLSGGKMAKLMQQAARGQLDSITLNNELVKMYPDMQRKAQAMGPGYINALQKALPSMANMLNSLGEMSTLTEKDRKNVEDEQKRVEEITNFYANFEKTIRNFRTSLEETFFKSKLFERLKGYFDGFLSGKTDQVPRILKELTDAFDATLTWMNVFLADVETQGLAATINDRAQKFVMWMFNLTEQGLEGMAGETKWAKIFNAVAAAIKEWWNSNTKEGSFFGDIKKEIAKGVSEGILDGTTKVYDAIKTFAFDHWKEILVGFGAIAALWLTKNFVGGMATGAGQRAGGGGGTTTAGSQSGGFLAGLGAQFTQAAGWLMKGAAIGASMIAIGYGLVKLAEGIKPFNDIEWGAMGKAGVALTALVGAVALLGNLMTGPQIIGLGIGAAAVAAVGLALRAFPTDVLRELSVLMATAFEGVGKTIERVFTGISNIISKITEMRTSVISATTEQIRQLAGIPADNMFAAAKGIQAIKDALDGFAPGIFSGISQSIGGLFAPDKVGPLDKMAMLGPQLQTAAAGFTAFKSAITGMNLANLSMTSEQTSSFESLTRRLPSFTESMTVIGAQATNINAAATAISAFKQATNGFDLKNFTFTKEQLVSLADGTTKLKALAEQLKSSREGFKKLDEQGLKNIKEGVEGLSKAFKEFNESFINKFIPKFEEMRSKTQEGILSDLGKKLDTLNSTVTSLITIEDTSRKHLDSIANKPPAGVLRK
jgi:hypothetical protein